MLKGVTTILLDEQSLQCLLEKSTNQSWQNQSTSWGKNTSQGNQEMPQKMVMYMYMTNVWSEQVLWYKTEHQFSASVVIKAYMKFLSVLNGFVSLSQSSEIFLPLYPLYTSLKLLIFLLSHVGNGKRNPTQKQTKKKTQRSFKPGAVIYFCQSYKMLSKNAAY